MREDKSRMTTVITKSAAEYWGWAWPADVSHTINGQPVTFKQLKSDRIEQQRSHLEELLRITSRFRPAYIWTFFVSGPFYSGWHLYLRTIKDSWWIRDCDEFALTIMRHYPCGLFPIPENFYAWKKAFAETYTRPSKRRPRQGMVIVWIKETGARPDFFLRHEDKVA